MPFFPHPVIPDAALNSGFLRFHKTLETPTSLLERSSLLQDMLAQIILCYAAEPPRLPALGQEYGAIRRAREYLEDCYAEDVTLEQLARLANLSAFHYIA